MFVCGQAFGAGGGRGGRRGAGFGAYGGPERGFFGPPMGYGRGHMSGQYHGQGIARALRGLDLTEQQRESIRNILESARETSESEREAVENARKALHTAVAEGADETAIREAASNLGKAIGDRAVSRAATMTSIKEVLTEEQLEQLQKMKSSESRDDLNGAGIQRRQMRSGNQPGLQGRGFGRPGRGAGRLGMGPAWQGRDRGPGPRPGFGIDRLIEQVDTNGDGTLTAEEIQAFKEQIEDQSR